jgi:RNA binding exosome subunit
MICTLKNNKKLFVKEENIRGMAGEPVSYLTMDLEGIKVCFDDISDKLKSDDKEELKEWINDLNEDNLINTINWAI